MNYATSMVALGTVHNEPRTLNPTRAIDRPIRNYRQCCRLLAGCVLGNPRNVEMSAMLLPCEPCVIIRPLALDGLGGFRWARPSDPIHSWGLFLQVPSASWLADAPDRLQAYAVATAVGDAMGVPVMDAGFDQ